MHLLKGRDLVESRSLTTEEISFIIDLAREMKSRAARGDATDLLPNVSLAALFHEPCESARLNLEVATTQLGGRAVFLTPDSLAAMGGASPRHTAELLGDLGAAILIRHPETITAGTKRLEEIARFADAPVINLRSDADEPLTALADLMTIREVFGGELKGRKLVLHWVASTRVDRAPVMPLAWLSLLTRFGMEVVVAHPQEFQLPEAAIKDARSNARGDSVRFEVVHTPQAALHHADIVCAANWGPPELLARKQTATSGEDRHAIEEQLNTLATRNRNWTINDDTLKHARPRAVHLHALPIERGVAIADSILDGQQSIWIQQAANRLHVTKAVLAAILRDRPLGPAV